MQNDPVTLLENSWVFFFYIFFLSPVEGLNFLHHPRAYIDLSELGIVHTQTFLNLRVSVTYSKHLTRAIIFIFRITQKVFPSTRLDLAGFTDMFNAASIFFLF